jgi:NhaP-type Na+/H+ or K+/H+ antiporter
MVVSLVLAIAVTLFVGVLMSGLARRSVLSTSVLFLGVGLVVGRVGLGLFDIDVDAGWLDVFITLVLFVVLFTDGMQVDPRRLGGGWRLSSRALGLGLPLTLALIAVAARWALGLSWVGSVLVAAALAPTDPVLARAIVGREGVPLRLQHLLNVESGLNDGLALPIVVVMLAVAHHESIEAGELIGELALGIALGIAIPVIGVRLIRLRRIVPTRSYRPIAVLAMGGIVYASALLLGANPFLAAFTAGITLAATGSELRDSFERVGEVLAEVLKLSALFLFGALISPRAVAELGWGVLAFAALVLFVARPAAMSLSLLRSPLDRRERLVAAWFGPKGFASVAYGLLILRQVPAGERLFGLIAIVTAISIVLHSSSDVPIARWFRRASQDEGTDGSRETPATGRDDAPDQVEPEGAEAPGPAERSEAGGAVAPGRPRR